jgi:hypothetical protein
MNPPLKTLAGALAAGLIGLSVTSCSHDFPTGPAQPAGWAAASSAQALSAPANDDFANAVVARLPFTRTLNTSAATTAADDPVPSCADGGRGPTVWFAFTPKGNKRIEANTFGSDYDTDLVIYTGTRGNLTEITCNDDAGDGVQSKVVFDAVAGTTYYIMVGAWNSGPGGNLVFNLVSPSAEVFRTVFFNENNLVHIIPEYNLTFTVGEVTPLADQLFCGGTEEYVSDVQARIQSVETPKGPVKLVRRVEGTFVLYDVSLFDLEDYCDLAQYEIGRGRGSFTNTDNSLTGVGPGINSFGFLAQAALVLTDGSSARFSALFRQLWDGVDPTDVTTVVDKVELK